MEVDPTQDTVRRKYPQKPQVQQQQPQNQFNQHQICGLDAVFLMDITQSMQKYVDGTLKSLQTLIKQLQCMFDKQVKIGFLGYRDFEKENPGEKQFDYLDLDSYDHQTIDESKLYQKLNMIKCSGGGDFAEDIRGAILQSADVMSWSGRQKYLVLIADAPAHGKKYNGNYGDNYPDAEPLDDALDLLIQKNIILIILEVSDYTKIMVQEIQSYYVKQGKEALFETNKLDASTIEEIASKLSKCLCDTIKRNISKDTIKKKQLI